MAGKMYNSYGTLIGLYVVCAILLYITSVSIEVCKFCFIDMPPGLWPYISKIRGENYYLNQANENNGTSYKLFFYSLVILTCHFLYDFRMVSATDVLANIYLGCPI